jgi:putative ABC transport system permease protein
MIKDYLGLVIRSIASRQLRSWLTMIGILIGVTAIVSLISLGLGLQTSITDQVQQLGTNRLLIGPGGEFLGPGTADFVNAELDDSDIRIIRGTRGVEKAEGVLVKQMGIEFDDKVEFNSVFAFDTTPEAREFVENAGLFDIEEGRELRSGDKFKVVLGYTLANEQYEEKIEVGKKILIRNQEFEVIGIQRLIGTGVHDTIVRMPQDTLRELLDEPKKLSLIFAFSKDGYTPRGVAERLTRELRSSRNVKEGEEDFNVQTAEQTIGELNTILAAVQAVILGIAAISILVGGIGIMNTMYTAVMERTREIGIMKAIGARNGHVLSLFLIESGGLGFLGGISGLTIGLGFAKIGELAAIAAGATFFKMYMGPDLIIGTLLFSTILGLFAGFLPSIQAARLEPVEALRR